MDKRGAQVIVDIRDVVYIEFGAGRPSLSPLEIVEILYTFREQDYMDCVA